MNRIISLAALSLSVMPLAFTATSSAADTAPLTQAQSIQAKTNHQSVLSQEKVDHVDEKTQALHAEIVAMKEQIANLKLYRTHMQRLIESQEQEKQSLQNQIKTLAETKQGLVPMMYHMLDALKQLSVTGKPIQQEQRQQRVAKLTRLMTRADVSDAEKFRRLLEALQIEMDYGNKLSVYQGNIQLSETGTAPTAIEVDLLSVGRLTFIARRFDHQAYWVWDSHHHQWQVGDMSDLPHVNQAFAIAQKEATPTLLTLPVSLVTAANPPISVSP